MMFYPVSGRVSSELAKGRGSVIHVIDVDEKPRQDHGGWEKALCGTTPSKLKGSGWISEGLDPWVSGCEKCLAKMADVELSLRGKS